ncbi:NHLP bacteriocin export ABC transporter permease/ATPase subunit [Christensenella tenuis]|uniref:NHLP bacteriocin export ABC transporter permease/ATPase subunit n=1 Tax=Christensenella tenuis TaxID=2763033 RepID=A0ABR7EDG9_9FIRM|nr:NHLP bacteriocin export ABC transporter permease/ATPase subunit [Christensenella tenuis]MBC5647693.1 NHLP bacteriocin export ABC transporter permease/ATPase subunit [Christensenella tenuis]
MNGQRQKKDWRQMEEAYEALLSVVRAHEKNRGGAETDVLSYILRYLNIQEPDIPAEITDKRERLEYVLRPSGVMYRTVRLDGDWWKTVTGPMLGTLEDGTPVALIPTLFNGYVYYDAEGNRIAVNRKTARKIQAKAISFTRSLPLRPIRLRDFLKFLLEELSPGDILWVLFASLCAGLLGMVLPYINQLIFDRIIPIGMAENILPAAALLAGATVGGLLFGISRSLVLARLSDKIILAARSASMARIMSLPPSFFKEYSAGDLAQRVNGMDRIAKTLSGTVLTTGLTAIFSFVYIFQMVSFSPQLVAPGMLMICASVAVLTAVMLVQARVEKKRVTLNAKTNGLIYGLYKGIQKIKIAGAEKRAFSKWAKAYAEIGTVRFRPPLFLILSGALTGAVSLGGTILLYYVAGTSGISQSDYIAFSTAYGAISSALVALAGVAPELAKIGPQIEIIQPVFDAQPEVDMQKKQPAALHGEIDISNVSFRYTEDMPLILDNFSLHIRQGEYVGIVGKSGCGKSTLLRLLIGFEQPESGAIYYDGNDMETLDLRWLRQKTGVVLQDGKLMNGDIFSNIIVTAPWSTMDDAWEAARLAGIAEDIEKMPMGMMTVIGEDGHGLSGGQKQRLLIARALVGKPGILLFDEATSALDNLVQDMVAENIARIGCTRIAVAHRLSTVRQCDRIIMIDGGRIAEEGSYEELMEKRGLFYEFAVRQIA